MSSLRAGRMQGDESRADDPTAGSDQGDGVGVERSQDEAPKTSRRVWT